MTQVTTKEEKINTQNLEHLIYESLKKNISTSEACRLSIIIADDLVKNKESWVN